jgi:plastocyanin
LIQNQENFPICVKLDTVPILLYRDWSYPTNCKYVHDPFTAGVEGLIVIEKNASDPSSDKSYSPRNSTVVIGWNNTISWINRDDYPSSVTSDWNLFDSGMILSGNDWKHNFDCAGNYGYHSEPHPWMKGWIRVLPPSR